MHKTLVIPSIRKDCLSNFLTAWKDKGDWDDVILVEDNPQKTFDADVAYHYSWEDIDKTLGDNAWIISRRDSAIRSFGFLMAYEKGADFVLTLDDDCYPFDNQPILSAHIKAMTEQSQWVESIPGMRTRGLPYFNNGKLSNVVANMGLWTKIPDLDSVQSLNDIETATNGNFIPPTFNHVMPRGQYFPLCGMNFAFRREVTPLTYFPLMGINSPYRRFDDIWFGVIFKKIIDHLGMNVTVGTPFIEHQRASSIMVNLVKEAPGIAANETFWTKVDNAELTSTTPTGAIIELGQDLVKDDDEYVQKLGSALMIWGNLFQ